MQTGISNAHRYFSPLGRLRGAASDYEVAVYAQAVLWLIDGEVFLRTPELIPDSANKWEGENPRTQPQKNEALLNAEFILYPSPNDGNMYLEYRYLNEKAHFELYDVTGRKIATYSLNTENGKLNITEQGLSNGVYIYRIINDNYKYKFGKVVIRK